MGREMATAMARPGDMMFGHRTWQAFITAWDAHPAWGRSRYKWLLTVRCDKHSC
jgi:hypothetical protein